MKTPLFFDGNAFAAAHPGIDFWIDFAGDFHCPALPDLTTGDLDACVSISAAKEIRTQLIDQQLRQCDADAIRPLRAVACGTATQADNESLTQIESRVVVLRAARATIVSATTVAAVNVVT